MNSLVGSKKKTLSTKKSKKHRHRPKSWAPLSLSLSQRSKQVRKSFSTGPRKQRPKSWTPRHVSKSTAQHTDKQRVKSATIGPERNRDKRQSVIFHFKEEEKKTDIRRPYTVRSPLPTTRRGIIRKSPLKKQTVTSRMSIQIQAVQQAGLQECCVCFEDFPGCELKRISDELVCPECCHKAEKKESPTLGTQTNNQNNQRLSRLSQLLGDMDVTRKGPARRRYTFSEYKPTTCRDYARENLTYTLALRATEEQ